MTDLTAKRLADLDAATAHAAAIQEKRQQVAKLLEEKKRQQVSVEGDLARHQERSLKERAAALANGVNYDESEIQAKRAEARSLAEDVESLEKAVPGTAKEITEARQRADRAKAALLDLVQADLMAAFETCLNEMSGLVSEIFCVRMAYPSGMTGARKGPQGSDLIPRGREGWNIWTGHAMPTPSSIDRAEIEKRFEAFISELRKAAKAA